MMSAATDTAQRGAWIGWHADRTGYSVTVYDDESREIHRYDAGNSPQDSAVYVPLDSKRPRVPVPTLRKWAKQTAQDIAAEYGVALVMIMEEENDA